MNKEKASKLSGSNKNNENSFYSPRTILDALFATMREAVIIVDPAGRKIIDCNAAVMDILGYEKSEIVGENTRLLHVDVEHYHRFGQESEQVLSRGQTFQTQYQMKRKDGTVIDTIHTVHPLIKEKGWTDGVVSIIKDISKREEAQTGLQNKRDENQSLLREVHHRVKNNLKIITSLLDLQEHEISNQDEAIDAFKVTRNRIYSMALVHEQLYQSNNLNKIEMSDYILTMSHQLLQSSGFDSEIKLDLQLDDIFLDINRAIPCGLILNELVTNAHKLVELPKSGSSILIKFKSVADDYRLTISDQGVGISDHLDLDDTNSLALQIISALVDQLKGKLEIYQEGKGTKIVVQFPQDTP
ncbi:MAG: sensor histidine kinase [Bacteroidota bacterium]